MADSNDENSFEYFEEEDIIEEVRCVIKEYREKEENILNIIFQYGDDDRIQRKQWIIDQILRIILSDEEKYAEWIKEYSSESTEGEWKVGIQP